jgi:hypothetical protein
VCSAAPAHQMNQNLRARTRVVNHIPFESRDIIKASPHMFVDLHQADIAGGGLEEASAPAETDKLSPAALLPARAL